MNFLFLMDPLSTVVMEKDTTFILMYGANKKKHNVFYLPKNGITFKEDRLVFNATQVVPQKDSNQPFLIKNDVEFTEDEVDAVFIRPDPPFDKNYLESTWLLDKIASKKVVINHPSSIRTCNEKIWATQFTDIIPPTLVSSNEKQILNFIQKHTSVVAKPTDGHGGKGVFRLEENDRNINVTLETLTENFTQNIIVQKFIPQADKGDKRIILLNGEPLGAVLRMHSDADHRNNFFSGGTALNADITTNDLKIIEILKPHLKKLELDFVGIDILGEYLIEVNVTSPTCLQEMNHFQNTSLENKVIEFVEKSVEEKRKLVKI